MSDARSPARSPIRTLLTPASVRTRAHRLLDLGIRGELRHFAVDSERLIRCATFVAQTIRRNYPTLDIPLHSRWRQFAAGGFDRWGTLARETTWPSDAAKARSAFDLAIISVLLDAGAGADWRYREAVSGETFSHSEGLAIASFDLFTSGALSEHPGDRLRADGAGLSALTPAALEAAFQVSPDNALVGIEGRCALLRQLGETVAANPAVFGRADGPRPGGLFDHLSAQAENGVIAAEAILSAVLEHLGPIWPGRIVLDGINLGDTWRHSQVEAADGTSRLMPLHKLSQWTAYSLIEPLQEAGIGVSGLDALTGLAEYRNGGLFIDTGLLVLKNPEDATRPHPVDSELVVEWRALTVALLDDVTVLVRQQLDRTAEQLPLAKVLQGGTWTAGRAIARQKRVDGSPPLAVISDGTVF